MGKRIAFTVLASVALVVMALRGAGAGHQPSGVASYTGCLSTKGQLLKVAPGDAPDKPCGATETAVHLSGGDVTEVIAGTGLSGGGPNGAITLGLQPNYQLPQGCTADQIASWTGSGWVCDNDQDTTYSAGSGLTLSETTFVADPSMVQSRVNDTCEVGSAIRAVNEDGTVVCEPDADTTYAAGAGLSLSGNTFSVDFEGAGTADTASRSDHTHGIVVKHAQVTGGVTHSTTATSSAPADLPGATITLSAVEVPVPSLLVITWSGRFYNTATGSGTSTGVRVDGILVGGSHITQPAPGDGVWTQHASNHVVAVAPGAHTVDVFWQVFTPGTTSVAADRYLTVLVIPQG